MENKERLIIVICDLCKRARFRYGGAATTARADKVPVERCEGCSAEASSGRIPLNAEEFDLGE